MTDQLQLTADVCQLHNMVHTALRDALTALLTLDTTLAQEVREKEKEIDRTFCFDLNFLPFLFTFQEFLGFLKQDPFKFLKDKFQIFYFGF